MFSQAEIGSFADLSYLLGIRQQSLNEPLNKLEKSGYVERRPSEEDRRVMVVHLTEKERTIQLPHRIMRKSSFVYPRRNCINLGIIWNVSL